jgi:hypothetical protein
MVEIIVDAELVSSGGEVEEVEPIRTVEEARAAVDEALAAGFAKVDADDRFLRALYRLMHREAWRWLGYKNPRDFVTAEFAPFRERVAEYHRKAMLSQLAIVAAEEGDKFSPTLIATAMGVPVGAARKALKPLDDAARDEKIRALVAKHKAGKVSAKEKARIVEVAELIAASPRHVGQLDVVAHIPSLAQATAHETLKLIAAAPELVEKYRNEAEVAPQVWAATRSYQAMAQPRDEETVEHSLPWLVLRETASAFTAMRQGTEQLEAIQADSSLDTNPMLRADLVQAAIANNIVGTLFELGRFAKMLGINVDQALTNGELAFTGVDPREDVIFARQAWAWATWDNYTDDGVESPFTVEEIAANAPGDLDPEYVLNQVRLVNALPEDMKMPAQGAIPTAPMLPNRPGNTL